MEIKDIRTISVTLEHKNVTNVARRDTLLRYVEHLQDNQTRKIQSSLEQLRLQNTHYVDTDQATPDQAGSEINDLWGMFTVNTVSDQPSSCISVKLFINGTPLNMTLDTGASVTIISSATWQQQLPDLKLQPSKVLLKTCTGEPLKLQGEAQVTVCYKDQKFKLPLIVVKGDGPPLLGRNWLQNIVLDWKEIKHVVTSLDGLLQKYNTLVDNKLGTMKGVQVKLAVKPDSKPKFCRA